MLNYLPVEIKTTGDLIDRLIIVNLKIWHLVDEAANTDDPEVQRRVNRFNNERTELIDAINRRFGERQSGGKVGKVSEV